MLPSTSEVVPAGQSVAEVAPVVLTNDPTGAGVHVAFPVVSVKVPGRQSVSDVAPGPVANEPAGAGVQGSFPVVLKVPAAQVIGGGGLPPSPLMYAVVS